MQFGAWESVDHWGRYRPSSAAIRWNGTTVTFCELKALVDVLGEAIADRCAGFQRVAIAIRSKAHLLAGILAILRCGKSVTLLNTGLPLEALRTNLQDADSAAIVHDEGLRDIAHMIPAARRRALNITQDLALAPNAAFPDRGPQQTQSPPAARTSRDEWGVLFSSGTTGVPKGIERNHESMVTELVGWCLELGLNRDTCFYIGRPIYYTGGLVLALSTLLVGGQVVLDDYGDPNSFDEVWAAYQRFLSSERAAFAFFVPDQLRAFVAAVDRAGVAPLAAHSVLVMGGPIAGPEKMRAARVLRSRIVESWGNTESLGTITDPEDVELRPDSIGRPFLTDSMCIVDENCEPLPPRQLGRIAGGEEAGFDGYSGRPEATQRTKRSGLIVSEDLGYVDDAGYFYVRGREQECVVVGGVTLFLSEIERKLRMSTRVRACCVAACPVGEGHSELAAMVVTASPDVTPASLLQDLNALLDAQERLAHVALADALPCLPSGKVNRLAIAEQLRDQAW